MNRCFVFRNLFVFLSLTFLINFAESTAVSQDNTPSQQDASNDLLNSQNVDKDPQTCELKGFANTDLKILTEDPDNAGVYVENDTSKYVVKDLDDNMIKYEFKEDAKCVSYEYCNVTVWSRETTETNQYPKAIYFHKHKLLSFVEFDEDTYYFYRFSKGTMTCKYSKINSVKQFSPYEFKVYTKSNDSDKAVENDSDKYEFKDYGFAYSYKFNQDVKCMEFKYGDTRLWNHDEGRYGDAYPLEIYFMSDLSTMAVFENRCSIFRPAESKEFLNSNQQAPKEPAEAPKPNENQAPDAPHVQMPDDEEDKPVEKPEHEEQPVAEHEQKGEETEPEMGEEAKEESENEMEAQEKDDNEDYDTEEKETEEEEEEEDNNNENTAEDGEESNENEEQEDKQEQKETKEDKKKEKNEKDKQSDDKNKKGQEEKNKQNDKKENNEETKNDKESEKSPKESSQTHHSSTPSQPEQNDVSNYSVPPSSKLLPNLLQVITAAGFNGVNRKTNDTSQYTVHPVQPNKLHYRFKEGTKCYQVKYNDQPVWRYNSEEHLDNFPTELQLELDKGFITVFSGYHWFCDYLYEKNRFVLEYYNRKLTPSEYPKEISFTTVFASNYSQSDDKDSNGYTVNRYYRKDKPIQIAYVFDEGVKCVSVEFQDKLVWKHQEPRPYPVDVTYVKDNNSILLVYHDRCVTYKLSGDQWVVAKEEVSDRKDESKSKNTYILVVVFVVINAVLISIIVGVKMALSKRKRYRNMRLVKTEFDVI